MENRLILQHHITSVKCFRKSLSAVCPGEDGEREAWWKHMWGYCAGHATGRVKDSCGQKPQDFHRIPEEKSPEQRKKEAEPLAYPDPVIEVSSRYTILQGCKCSDLPTKEVMELRKLQSRRQSQGSGGAADLNGFLWLSGFCLGSAHKGSNRRLAGKRRLQKTHQTPKAQTPARYSASRVPTGSLETKPFSLGLASSWRK
uniref:Uncharacterized protein n=1 Tax=Molossus molossus TaxID=27622 RepID=A0A7J8I8L7_MOLMO|nr:hypothetical protein HJG59_010517 [Molossus molossus]